MSNYAKFNALNIQMNAVSAQIAYKLAEAGDVEGQKLILNSAIKIMRECIELAKVNGGHDAWRTWWMTTYSQTPLSTLDTTGEFIRLFEEIREVDTTEYYDIEVKDRLTPAGIPEMEKIIESLKWAIAQID